MNAEMQRQNFFIGGLFWDAARVAGEDLVRDPIVSQSTMGLKLLYDDSLAFMPTPSAKVSFTHCCTDK